MFYRCFFGLFDTGLNGVVLCCVGVRCRSGFTLFVSCLIREEGLVDSGMGGRDLYLVLKKWLYLIIIIRAESLRRL